MADVLSKYSIVFPTLYEADDVFDVLSEALVRTKNVTPETTAMDTRKLNHAIDHALIGDNIVALVYDGYMVGAMIVGQLGGKNYILHSNIVQAHKKTAGSVLLIDHIVNTMFKDEAVFISDVTDEYRSMVDVLPFGLCKIKDNAKVQFARFLGRPVNV